MCVCVCVVVVVVVVVVVGGGGGGINRILFIYVYYVCVNIPDLPGLSDYISYSNGVDYAKYFALYCSETQSRIFLNKTFNQCNFIIPVAHRFDSRPLSTKL